MLSNLKIPIVFIGVDIISDSVVLKAKFISYRNIKI